MPNPSIQSKVSDDRRLRILLDGQAQASRGAPILMKESERAALSTKKLYAGLRVFCPDSDRDWLYDGTGWIIMYEPWQAHTPTWTNLTVGNGTQSWVYRRSNGQCTLWGSITFGGTTAVSGLIGLSLPVAASAATPPLTSHGRIVAGSSFVPYLFLGATTRLDLYVIGAGGTYASLAGTSATAPPAAWASGHVIELATTFVMGSIYS